MRRLEQNVIIVEIIIWRLRASPSTAIKLSHEPLHLRWISSDYRNTSSIITLSVRSSRVASWVFTRANSFDGHYFNQSNTTDFQIHNYTYLIRNYVTLILMLQRFYTSCMFMFLYFIHIIWSQSDLTKCSSTWYVILKCLRKTQLRLYYSVNRDRIRSLHTINELFSP